MCIILTLFLQPAANTSQTKKAALEKYKALFAPKPKNLKVSGDLKPKGYINLHRFVKWPLYVRLQRQKAVLKKRLRVPPAIAQFSRAAPKPLAYRVMSFLSNYKTETRTEKKLRLKGEAEKKLKGEQVTVSKPVQNVVSGLNKVVKLVEKKKAQLVVIAHNVDPIEMVVYLPALCKKMNVPYIIVKSQNRLGQIVHRNKAAVLAVTDVKKEDKSEFEQIVNAAKGHFNERYNEVSRHWGGGLLNRKQRFVMDARAKDARAK